MSFIICARGIGRRGKRQFKRRGERQCSHHASSHHAVPPGPVFPTSRRVPFSVMIGAPLCTATFAISCYELFSADGIKEIVRQSRSDAWGMQKQLSKLGTIYDMAEESFFIGRVDMIPKLLKHGAYDAVVHACLSSVASQVCQ